MQSPLNSQSLNPYSYIMNNPLAGTDPTGYACVKADASSEGCDVRVHREAPAGSNIRSGYRVSGQSKSGGTIGASKHGDKVVSSSGSFKSAANGAGGGALRSDSAQKMPATARDTGALEKRDPSNQKVDAPQYFNQGCVTDIPCNTDAPHAPRAPRTTLQKVTDFVGDVAQEVLYRAQAIPAEAAVIGVVGKAKGVMAADEIAEVGFATMRVEGSLAVNAVKAADLGYDANKMAHVFAEKHMMGPLVKSLGSEGAALVALHSAAQSLATTSYQTGAWASVKVGDIAVAVKGVIIDGQFRISTATMKHSNDTHQ